jgi:hypothetical protein
MDMPTDIPIRCRCSALRGVLRSITSSNVNRVVCYCDDCQTFAHALGRAEVLDPHGGSDIVQMSPARVEITAGAEQLACLQLREGGLARWHTRCCRTPIGNTLATSGTPFVGLIRGGCLDADPGGPTEAAIGPIRGRIQGRYARGDRSRLRANDGWSAWMMLRIAWIIATARLRGDQRRSPFFRPTGEIAVAPRVLGAEELRAAESARDAS